MKDVLIFKAKDESIRPLRYLLYGGMIYSLLDLTVSENRLTSTIIFGILGLITISTFFVYEKTIIDLGQGCVMNKKIFSNTKRHTFNQLTKIYINPIKQSQTVSSRVNTTTINQRLYAGFITLDNKTKIKIIVSKEKQKVTVALNAISKLAGLTVEDRSM